MIIKNLIAKIILIIFLVAGLFSYKEYGIGWDEDSQYIIGEMSYNYVFKNDDKLMTFYDRDYGPVFETSWIMIEKTFHISDEKTIFQTRHLLTHLLFLPGAWAIFLLIKRLFKDDKLALIGMLLYLLHPRIYADSFHNSKDVPFLAMYAIALFWAAKAFENKKAGNFIFLGILTGILINLRIMGVLHFAMVLFFLLVDLLANRKDRNELLKNIKSFTLFTIFSLGTLLLTWPYLWSKPLTHFVESFNSMSKFRWDGTILMAGDTVHSLDLPWYYFPLWFGVTTPVFTIILFIAGLSITLLLLVKSNFKLLRNVPERNVLLALTTIIAPVGAVLVLHSVLYDAWRQLFFVYPAMIILCVYALQFFKQKMNPKSIYSLCFVFMIFNIFEIAKLYPHQNVYFNQFVNKDKESVRDHYDQDYWALSFKQNLDFIVKNDPREDITVLRDIAPLYANIRVLFDKKKIRIVDDINEADYVLKTYRFHPEDYEEYKGKEYHSIIVNNSKINTAFRLR